MPAASRWRGRCAVLALLVACVGATLPATVRAQGTLRIAAYNVKHGLGMDGVVDLERIADVLRSLDADVITLQEIDSGTERTERVDQAARLGELLGEAVRFGE